MFWTTRKCGFLIAMLLIPIIPQIPAFGVDINPQLDVQENDAIIAQGGIDDILEVRWWSRDSSSPHVLVDDATIIGDQIVLEAEFELSEGDPDLNVEEVSWSASRGFFEERRGDLIIPSEGYEPFIMGLNISELVWERIDGIERGDNVRLYLDHSNRDTDVIVYWAETNSSFWMTDGGLTGRQMATPQVPERGSFIADRDGAIMVGIYSYDHLNGTYRLTVDTREEETGIAHGNLVRYETWTWGRNVTVSLEFRGRATNGTILSKQISNLTLNGFFTPRIANVRIIPDGILRYVTWDVIDRNQNDDFTTEILISLDGGLSFQLIASTVSDGFYEWNTGGFDAFETCVVMVRSTDSNGLTGIGLSETFSVGANSQFTGSHWFATSSSGNSTFTYGTSENRVSWEIWIQNDIPMMYNISLDETVIQTGWTTSGVIEVYANNLDLGIHSLTLSLFEDDSVWNDTLYIEVVPNPQFILVQLLSSFAATIFIAVVVVLHEYSRRISQK